MIALAEYFHRNGYVRRQNATRLSREGYMGYKKGDEVRLCARSAVELEEIRRLLVLAGFRPGRPFTKDRHYRQPVYGQEAVRRFLELARAHKSDEPDATPNRRPALPIRARRVDRALDSSPVPVPGGSR